MGGRERRISIPVGRSAGPSFIATASAGCRADVHTRTAPPGAIKSSMEMSTKIAFLFPGQGSQAVGMGRELAERFPVAAQTFAEADAALGFPLSRLCFEGPEEDLRLTENTQPAIMTVSVAAARVLAEHGVAPALAAGHSLGEWSAHVLAGTLSFADAVRAVKARGAPCSRRFRRARAPWPPCSRSMPRWWPRPAQEAARETGLVVQAANLNSPGQTVISGAAAAVERASALCKEKGARRAVMLPVSAPFHCALMQPAQEEVARVLGGLAMHDPRIPVAANVTGGLVTTADATRDALIRQVTGAVRWMDCMQALKAARSRSVYRSRPRQGPLRPAQADRSRR